MVDQQEAVVWQSGSNDPTAPDSDKPATTPDSDKPTTLDSGVVMHRMCNPNFGEHFYTASNAERDHLISIGWNDKGTAWHGLKLDDKHTYIDERAADMHVAALPFYTSRLLRVVSSAHAVD